MPPAVFVDTSAWVGFFSERDQYHEKASREMDRLGAQGRWLMTSDYVMAETITRMRQQVGLGEALKAWEELERGESVGLVEVSSAHRTEAREILRKYRQLPLSAVDAVSIVIMRGMGVQEVFTFDDDFRKAGFIVVPPPH